MLLSILLQAIGGIGLTKRLALVLPFWVQV